jgi:hypothetical protein
MPPVNQDDGSQLSDQEEYDLEQAELIAAAGGKAAGSDDGSGKGAGAGAETPEQKALAAAEAEAVRKGWKPKDAYEGDPDKWVDAKTFLDRGDKFNKNLQREVAALKAKLESFEGTKQAFVKFHEETVAAKDKELAAALKQLRVQRSEAQAEGDHEAAVEIEDRIEVITKERQGLKDAAPVPAAAPQVDPVLEAWIGDGNDWFAKDAKLRNYAITLADELRADGETLQGRQFLDKVAELMRAEFPSKFDNPNRQRPGAVEGSSRSAVSAPQGRTERDLPKVDRELMNEFVRNGWTTKEKFLAEYRWPK